MSTQTTANTQSSPKTCSKCGTRTKSAAEIASGKRGAIARRYKRANLYVFAHVAPEFRKRNVPLTDDVIHKMTFEIFKTWQDVGCLL